MYTFTKQWSDDGFKLDEAVEEASKINEAFGVDEPNSNWKPAKWIPDYDKKNGYKVIIERKQS